MHAEAAAGDSGLSQPARTRTAAFASYTLTGAFATAIGSLCAALGGLDSLVFSGGIGENSAPTRAAVLRGMASFGVELDDAGNASIQGEGEISTLRSAVKVLVIPANEESIVARETVAVVKQQAISG